MFSAGNIRIEGLLYWLFYISASFRSKDSLEPTENCGFSGLRYNRQADTSSLFQVDGPSEKVQENTNVVQSTAQSERAHDYPPSFKNCGILSPCHEVNEADLSGPSEEVCQNSIDVPSPQTQCTTSYPKSLNYSGCEQEISNSCVSITQAESSIIQKESLKTPFNPYTCCTPDYEKNIIGKTVTNSIETSTKDSLSPKLYPMTSTEACKGKDVLFDLIRDIVVPTSRLNDNNDKYNTFLTEESMLCNYIIKHRSFQESIKLLKSFYSSLTHEAFKRLLIVAFTKSGDVENKHFLGFLYNILDSFERPMPSKLLEFALDCSITYTAGVLNYRYDMSSIDSMLCRIYYCLCEMAQQENIDGQILQAIDSCLSSDDYLNRHLAFMAKLALEKNQELSNSVLKDLKAKIIKQRAKILAEMEYKSPLENILFQLQAIVDDPIDTACLFDGTSLVDGRENWHSRIPRILDTFKLYIQRERRFPTQDILAEIDTILGYKEMAQKCILKSTMSGIDQLQIEFFMKKRSSEDEEKVLSLMRNVKEAIENNISTNDLELWLLEKEVQNPHFEEIFGVLLHKIICEHQFVQIYRFSLRSLLAKYEKAINLPIISDRHIFPRGPSRESRDEVIAAAVTLAHARHGDHGTKMLVQALGEGVLDIDWKAIIQRFDLANKNLHRSLHCTGIKPFESSVGMKKCQDVAILKKPRRNTSADAEKEDCDGSELQPVLEKDGQADMESEEEQSGKAQSSKRKKKEY